MSQSKPMDNAFLSNFSSRRSTVPDQLWLQRIRNAAINRFAELGLPSTLEEEWKYTNVAPLGRIDFQLADESSVRISRDQLETMPFSKIDCHRLVFVNGRYAHELSSLGHLPVGVKIQGLEESLASEQSILRMHLTRNASFDDRPFVALNTAFIRDGAFIEIPDGIVLEKPIYLSFVSAADGKPMVTHQRNLILMGRNSQATIIEGYLGVGDGPCFTNPVTEIVLGENAIANHYKLQYESAAAFHIGLLDADQDRGSGLFSLSVSLGGGLVRNEIATLLAGQGSECRLDGLYLARGRQHIDNHTVIDHATRNSTSREFYKGILDDAATAVFNGRIVVRKDAQKTDARQTNRNLLLSADAEINSKPELQIFADDVKCSHGATIGQLDREALFYLRSRGIGQEEARAMLTFAFADEVLVRIGADNVRDEFSRTVKSALSQISRSQDS